MDKTEIEDYQIELLDLRTQLNTIDEKLIKLLISRFYITNKIGKIKLINNQPIYDQMREAAIFQNMSELIRNTHQSKTQQTDTQQSNTQQTDTQQTDTQQSNTQQIYNHTSNQTCDPHSQIDLDVEMLVTCISEIYREIMNQSKISQAK